MTYFNSVFNQWVSPSSVVEPLQISPIDRLAQNILPTSQIVTGQGEYAVFYADPEKELTFEVFAAAYTVLNAYQPSAIVERGEGCTANERTDRYEIMQQKILEIDSDLKIIFIPRTLYELIFIRKCINEDLKNKSVCKYLQPDEQRPSERMLARIAQYQHQDIEAVRQELNEERVQEQQQRKCWHLCYFTAHGECDSSNLSRVAYRLNRVFIKILGPRTQDVTYSVLSSAVEKEINYLHRYYRTQLSITPQQRVEQNTPEISDCSFPGPTTNFGYESTRGRIKPMGIRNDQDAQIIRNAVVLECSSETANAFVLYRGSNFQKDSPLLVNEREQRTSCYSLSFGSGLFAGAIYDGGATAFHYMRDRKLASHAYAILVPWHQAKASPFYIPPGNTLTQLFGDGESFHSRTKAWQGVEGPNLGGIYHGLTGGRDDQLQHLQSTLSQEELLEQFTSYKQSAIQLA